MSPVYQLLEIQINLFLLGLTNVETHYIKQFVKFEYFYVNFHSRLDGGGWINSILNGVGYWRAVAAVELRNRSDIGKPNTSPQTTILPALR